MTALAPITAETGIPCFTKLEAESVAAFCKARIERANAATWTFPTDKAAHIGRLSDVRFAALSILDGDPAGHGELQALMEEWDYLPLWEAVGA